MTTNAFFTSAKIVSNIMAFDINFVLLVSHVLQWFKKYLSDQKQRAVMPGANFFFLELS